MFIGYLLLATSFYFYSYGVLAKLYPQQAQSLAVWNLEWLASTSKTSYFGWLMLGYYVPLVKGHGCRWVFEVARLLLAGGYIMILFHLWSLLPPKY